MHPFRQQRNQWIGLGLGVALVAFLLWSDRVPSRQAPTPRRALASR